MRLPKLCVIKWCNKKSRSWGFCPKHLYAFVDKQRMEVEPKKEDYSHLSEEYKPVRFKVDVGEYERLTVS